MSSITMVRGLNGKNIHAIVISLVLATVVGSLALAAQEGPAQIRHGIMAWSVDRLGRSLARPGGLPVRATRNPAVERTSIS